MLFNDFYGMKTLIERFLNPNLLENLKKSEKEEDKLEVEKSTLFNRIIIKSNAIYYGKNLYGKRC